MGCYKNEHIIIVKTHYKYEESFANTIRKFRAIFGRSNQSTVKKLIKKFKQTCSIVYMIINVRHLTERSIQNIVVVTESVVDSLEISIHLRL